MANNPIYVVDTNVLIDYPDVIPQPNGKKSGDAVANLLPPILYRGIFML